MIQSIVQMRSEKQILWAVIFLVTVKVTNDWILW